MLDIINTFALLIILYVDATKAAITTGTMNPFAWHVAIGLVLLVLTTWMERKPEDL